MARRRHGSTAAPCGPTHAECDAFSWRHEIAHPLTPPRQGHEQQWLVADALLSYLEVRNGESILRQRFIELNLATTSTEQLAAKLAKYKLLHNCTAPTAQPGEPTEPLWRSHYRTFPQLLVVLAGQTPAHAQRRVRHLISPSGTPIRRPAASTRSRCTS